MPPPGRSWFSGSLSSTVPAGSLLALNEPSGRRVHHVRHLIGGVDLVRNGLLWLGMLHRQPLVAALPVADEPGRQPSHGAALQVLVYRHLRAGEVGDVPARVGVGPVLRTYVEELQATPELVQTTRPVPDEERFELVGGA